MLKRGILGMVVGIALTGAVLAVTASGSTRSHSAGHVRLHLIEHPVNEHVVDLPPRGVDSQGDQFPFSNLLFDKSDSHQVGRDQGNCIRTNPNRGEWQCCWTNKLGNGEITVEGPFYDTHDSVVAVTGGTGRYANVRGSMELKSRAGGTEFDFIFHLIG